MIIILLYYLLFIIIYSTTRPISPTRPICLQKQSLLVFLLLFIFWGFRDLSVLNDTNHYYQAQYALLSSSQFINTNLWFIDSNNIWEPGFQILSCIIGKIWPDPYAIICLSAFAVIIATLWFTSKYTNQLSLVAFMLLGFGIIGGQFSALRQGWAMSCMYIAYHYRDLNKHITPCLLVMLAMQFHSSALIGFLFLALTYFDTTKRNILIFTLVSIFTVISLYPILDSLSFGESKYLISAAERESLAIGAIMILILQLFTVLVSFRLSRRYYISINSNVLVWGCVFGAFCNMAAIQIQVFTRFSVYFGIFPIIYLIIVLSKTPYNVRIKWLIFFVILLLTRSAIIMEFKNEWSHMVPYSLFNIFDGIKIIDYGY